MDNTIEETLSALEAKHLAGQHDQRRHGRAAGSHAAPLTPKDIRSVQPGKSEADEILERVLRGVGDVTEGTDAQKRAQEHLATINLALPGFDADLPYGPPASESRLGKAYMVLGKHNNLQSFPSIALSSVYMHEPALLLGHPGSGKTSMAKLLAYMKMPPGTPKEAIKHAVVNCTPKTSTDSAVGFLSAYSLLNKKVLTEEDVQQKRFLGFPVRVLDEFNRMPDHVQAGCLPLIENSNSGNSSILFHDIPWTIPAGAWLMTLNKPGAGFKGGEGTFPLVPALIDRVGAIGHATGLGPSTKESIRRDKEDISYLDFVHDSDRITDEDLVAQREAIKNVVVPNDIMYRLDYLLGGTKYVPGVSQDLNRSTRGRALASADRDRLAAHLETLENQAGLSTDVNPS